jgi:hypothetical protein
MKHLIMALTLLMSCSAFADECRTKAIEGAETAFGDKVKTVQVDEKSQGIFVVTLKPEGEASVDFDVLFVHGNCNSKPIVMYRPKDDPNGVNPKKKPAICFSKMARKLPKICFEK